MTGLMISSWDSRNPTASLEGESKETEYFFFFFFFFLRAFHNEKTPIRKIMSMKRLPENIILGKGIGGLFLNRESRKRWRELVERSFGFRIDLQEKVVNLSVGMKRSWRYSKTLYRPGQTFIILDEPTRGSHAQEVRPGSCLKFCAS